MSRPSSVLWSSCGTLVGVKDRQCLSCGRLYPGMWGFAHLLRKVGDDMGFGGLVMWACGALFLACLAVNPEGVQTSGLTSFLSPSIESLFLFGASGAVPVFAARWLDPLKPERADHVLVALGCLVLSLLSIGFSVVYGLELFRS